jgi:biopolymer transport protein ExbB/TolQ
MYPLVICSLFSWVIIFERLWRYRKLGHDLKAFHLEALNALLRATDTRGSSQQSAGPPHPHDGGHGTIRQLDDVRRLCDRNPELPTARVLAVAVERLSAGDLRIRSRWTEGMERRRQLINQELRQGLWILGTVGSSAPFIGLLGTVVGILRSFQEMAVKGAGGFAVVAAGISESLIATAAGIVVAVIAVMAYNAFQTRWGSLVIMIRIHAEEFAEILQSFDPQVGQSGMISAGSGAAAAAGRAPAGGAGGH